MFGLAGFMLGAILGSFAKATADRILADKRLTGRSYCWGCSKKLRWHDLIPILSYLILKGRCRYCQKDIGIGNLITELFMGLLVGFLFWQSYPSLSSYSQPLLLPVFILDLGLKTFFITVLAIVTITDLREMFIPDKITIPSIASVLIVLVTTTTYKIALIYISLGGSILGKYLLPPYTDSFQRHALITVQPFLGSIAMGTLIALFFFLLVVVTGGRGMGGGDVKLGALIGLALGFPFSILALFLAFITGAVFSLGLVVGRKKKFGEVVPFGPFLVLGSLLALFWGQRIINWYLAILI